MRAHVVQSDSRWIPLADNSVDLVVTSPPYLGLRKYEADGQIGLEQSVDEYIDALMLVFGECWRVLKDWGSLWVNIGDSYAPTSETGSNKGKHGAITRDCQARAGMAGDLLKPLDLIGVPWKLAFALRDAGWYLRMDNIWVKKSWMPESVKGWRWEGDKLRKGNWRPTRSHEYIFQLQKTNSAYYDGVAVAEELAPASFPRALRGLSSENKWNKAEGSNGRLLINPAGRNLRSCWQNISPQPYGGEHYAAFPPDLPTIPIKAGTSEKGNCPECGMPWARVVERTQPPIEVYTDTSKPDKYVSAATHPDGDSKLGFGQKWQNWKNENPDTTLGWRATCECGHEDTVPPIVLDPFGGTGTTAMVAMQLGRRGIALDLSTKYCELSMERCGIREMQDIASGNGRKVAANWHDLPMFQEASE